MELFSDGTRYGKKRLAQKRAGNLFQSSDNNLIYLATATVRGNDKIPTRIARHCADRPALWQTSKEIFYLAEMLATCNAADILLADFAGISIYCSGDHP